MSKRLQSSDVGMLHVGIRYVYRLEIGEIPHRATTLAYMLLRISDNPVQTLEPPTHHMHKITDEICSVMPNV